MSVFFILSSIVLSIIVYIFYKKLDIIELFLITSFNKSNSIDNKDKEMYNFGSQNMFILIEICLFKMSEDGNLFGHESILNELKKMINEFTLDNNKFNEWRTKYINKITEGRNQEKEPL